ncbi:MAG TPA: helix-turn-helix domain-containing protein [Candidatus Nanoarchaeia archaeon]|nr:helix-turn-helix domain-containing protein [Candidatus Nanoarchaeia archaeon]
MKELFEVFGLSQNEIKVYGALLKIKNGTKTPIVKESGVLSSKVYEVLDRLIKKGLVASFIEDNVKHYVPVHPSNIKSLFDEKIKEIRDKKREFEEHIDKLFPKTEDFLTEVQLFRDWDGLKNVLLIIDDDLKKGDTYYILGASPGEDSEKAIEIFSKNDQRLDAKKIKIRAIHDVQRKKEAKEYLREYGKKKWTLRYSPVPGPFQIGITNNYALLILLEKNPIAILINNKRIRDSFLHYFHTLWELAKN